jgi:hypothetical protein
MNLLLRRLGLLVLGCTVLVAPGSAPRRPVVRGVKGNLHADRAIDRKYFQEDRLVVTPLRSEVARLLLRGQPLPAGVERIAPAPNVLTLVLPPAPGCEYAIVGDRIVLVDSEGLVEDILQDIFSR